MKKPKYKLNELLAQCDLNAPVPKDVSVWEMQEPICEHDWQPDGQTMTSVRWTCTKCHKTQLNGPDI